MIERVFFVGTIALIVLKRNEVKKFIKGIKVEKGLMKVAFTSVWMLIFLACQMVLAISGIEKLPIK